MAPLPDPPSSSRPRPRLALLAAAIGFAASLLAFLVLFVALRPQWVLEAVYAVDRWRSGAVEEVVQLGDYRIVVLAAGPRDAPPIVLLHGFTGSKENWLPLMRELSDRYRVLAPDLPGWGESSRIAGADYGVLAQASRLSNWIEQLPRPPELLVGHSMGGHIAALIAAQHPGRVPRLGLLAAAGVPFAGNEFALAVLAGEHPFAVEARDDLKRHLGLVFSDPPFLPWPLDRALVERRRADLAFEREVLAKLAGPERFAVQPLLPAISASTLLLWCQDDRVIDPSAAAVFAAGLRHSQLQLLPDCGHMPMMAAAQASAEALRRLLAMPAHLGGGAGGPLG